jgi:hypothetical protein
MKYLNDNLTFAVIVKDVAWRTDLTVRFCEYFSQKINSDKFIEKIVFPVSIDAALSTCETDYLLIQSSGHIVYDMAFLEMLDEKAGFEEDIVIGFIEIAEDYAVLDEKCMFINMTLWKKHGRPRFTSRIRQGVPFKLGSFENKDHPLDIIATNDEPTFIDNEAATKGAHLISNQLQFYGQASSLTALSMNKESHYLDTSSAYREIHTDTIFEKQYLALTKKRIFGFDDDIIDAPTDIFPEIIICPAQGLKAHSLVNHFKVKELVIYDSNALALELQKRIFSISKSTTYGEIVKDFLKDFPGAPLDSNWVLDKYTAVKKLKVNIRFELVDAFSFEMEDLIKSIDDTVPAIFDLSDIFVYPYNFFRKPLFLVEGLFAELYSLMKSRRGPTSIFGYAPGFQSMDTVKINTSRRQYEVDPSVDPFAIDESIPEKDRVEVVVEPIMFHPPDEAERIPERQVKSSWLSTIKNAISKPKVAIKEVIIDRVVEVEKIVYVDKIIYIEKIIEAKPVVEVTPLNNEPEQKVETVVEEITVPIVEEKYVPLVFVPDSAPAPINTDIQISITSINEEAKMMGYQLSKTPYYLGSKLIYLHVITKNVKFPEIDAIYEYSYNDTNNAWSFKVGRVGHDTRIEFSNGLTIESFYEHLKLETKFAPKTAAKYFK